MKKRRKKDEQFCFNVGYVFLQDIYHSLGLNNICNDISEQYKFKYDLDNIVSRLIYSRIIYPSSKLATFELSKRYIERPNFELHDIYRALEVIAKETDFIQAELYKNSLKVSKRNTNEQTTLTPLEEKILDEKYTSSLIIDTLKNMNMQKNFDCSYEPIYTRTDLTDNLHEKFGFRTDYEILPESRLKKFYQNQKNDLGTHFFINLLKTETF